MATNFAGRAQGLLNTIDFIQKQPEYDVISASNDDGQSLVRQASVLADSKTQRAGLSALGILSKQEALNAQAAQAANQKAGGMIGQGFADGVGSLIKGFYNQPPS